MKRKQLKKKKDRVLDGAVESESAAGHGSVKGIASDCFVLFLPVCSGESVVKPSVGRSLFA